VEVAVSDSTVVGVFVVEAFLIMHTIIADVGAVTVAMTTILEAVTEMQEQALYIRKGWYEVAAVRHFGVGREYRVQKHWRLF
jgi:hypothetical protein